MTYNVRHIKEASLTFRLPGETLDALKAEAVRDTRSTSSLALIAVRELLARREAQRRGDVVG